MARLLKAYLSILLAIACVAILLKQRSVLLRDYKEHLHRKKQNEQYKEVMYSLNQYSRGIPYYPKGYRKLWLTIGIPTYKRQNENQLFTTIQSLFENEEYRYIAQTYVVVFLAEFENFEWKNETEKRLKQMFPDYYKRQTLIVIKAPREFYPEHNQQWHVRIKQNYDHAFIVQYCKDLSSYYMQLEDDVIAEEGYLKSISTFMKENKSTEWICLKFAETGFLGNLYRSEHVQNMAKFLTMCSKEHLVDKNIAYFLEIKRIVRGIRVIHQPALFNPVK